MTVAERRVSLSFFSRRFNSRTNSQTHSRGPALQWQNLGRVHPRGSQPRGAVNGKEDVDEANNGDAKALRLRSAALGQIREEAGHNEEADGLTDGACNEGRETPNSVDCEDRLGGC